jgi:hypothetical protein
LVAIKAFFVVLILLIYFGSSTFFDFSIEKAHDRSLERINKMLMLMGGRLDLPYEYTYSIMALLAAMISFSLVRINIKGAYYFYVLTKDTVSQSLAKNAVDH